jgi:hypothetical protein
MIDIFIPSYKRAKELKTIKFLNKIGYDMQKVHVVIDNETPDIEDYKEKAKKNGFNLFIFDINEARRRYDFVHRKSPSRRAAGMARNMFYDIAKGMGIEVYCVMDDDTKVFAIRPNQHYERLANGDDVIKAFDAIAEFIKKYHIGLFGLPQVGDIFVNFTDKLIHYKVMNCSFYNVKYIYRGERGLHDDDTSQFVTILNDGLFTGSLFGAIYLDQTMSATAEGGLTEIYNETKLFSKAIICPIQLPSCIHAEKQKKIGGRLHHRINYNFLVPKILKIPNYRINTMYWDAFEEDIPFTNEPKREKYDL